MTSEEAEPLFRKKIEEARARGITLIHHRLRVGEGAATRGVCGLGAYLLDRHLPNPGLYAEEAARVLGTTYLDIAAFISGWDLPEDDNDNSWAKLGQRLRVEFEPVVHYTTIE